MVSDAGIENEELILHLIDQQMRIDQLERQNRQLLKKKK